ncbi:MAG: protein kinase, partial [Gemmatimonadales bacterium]
MASLLERLQEALSPDYDVQRELAAGGMGIVFLARHLGLDRRVAIKVLAPELASSVAAQRFLHEARILASLSHSHVIPIHHVGEADGLFYYVMDYIDGDTLADALGRGPMSVEDVVKLGRDLLDALEAVHDRDVVHRDVKPANIFLSGKRALLGDFGIAKQDSGSDQTLTQPGGVIGTPSYMAPEQLAGETVTARTDIYAVAMVLYEALTCRQWKVVIDPGEASWAGIPMGVARVLRGALAFLPADRWPDAVTFRHKLWGTRVRRYQWRTAALTAAGIVVGVLGIWAFGLLNRGPGPGGLSVQLTQFQEEGDVPPGLTQLVMDFVVRGLGQSLEFQVCEPEEACPNPTVTLDGTVRVSEGTLYVTVTTEDRVQYSSRDGQTTEWRDVADLVTADVLRTLWSKNGPLAEWLPLNALPTSTAGVNLWLEAERIFNEGRWGDAREPYLAAYGRDPTCFLCLWRLREIGRQYGAGADAALKDLILGYRDSFPEWYQPLIELDLLEDPAERLDLLEKAADQWPDFFYLRSRLCEEIFNRGPLAGRSRLEAIRPLADALAHRPGFAPALETLASVAIAEGDRETAVSALERLNALPTPTDPFQGAYRILIQTGFAYRFRGNADGANVVRFGLAQPGMASMPVVVVWARLMPSFDSPDGAIDVGRLLETDGRGGTRWKLAGLMGQMFGYLAMGQLDLARVHARTIVRMGQLDDFSLFADQLDAFLMMFDEAAAGLDGNDV